MRLLEFFEEDIKTGEQPRWHTWLRDINNSGTKVSINIELLKDGTQVARSEEKADFDITPECKPLSLCLLSADNKCQGPYRIKIRGLKTAYTKSRRNREAVSTGKLRVRYSVPVSLASGLISSAYVDY